MTDCEQGQLPAPPSESNQSLAPPEDPDAMLRQVEDDLSITEFASQRARVFRRAAELLRAKGREAEAQSAGWQGGLFDFMLVPRDERRSHYGRFAPMIEMGGRAYPHVSAFPPDSLLAFKGELDRSTNPIHLAMYGDFIWDQREKYLGPRKDVVQAAKVAIDSVSYTHLRAHETD